MRRLTAAGYFPTQPADWAVREAGRASYATYLHLFPEVSGEERILAMDCNPDSRTKTEDEIWKSELQLKKVHQVADISRDSLFILSCPN